MKAHVIRGQELQTQGMNNGRLVSQLQESIWTNVAEKLLKDKSMATVEDMKAHVIRGQELQTQGMNNGRLVSQLQESIFDHAREIYQRALKEEQRARKRDPD